MPCTSQNCDSELGMVEMSESGEKVVSLVRGFSKILCVFFACVLAIAVIFWLTSRAAADELISDLPVKQSRAKIENSQSQLTPSEFKYKWDARLFGLGVSDDVEESRVTGLTLLGGGEAKFNEYLDAGAAARARLESGSTHALFETNRVNNGIWLDEAYANVHPLPGYMVLSAGALNQRMFQNPLLFDEIAFPATRERLYFQNSVFGIGLVFQQAIPTSTSLSTRTVEKEALPTLYTEGLVSSLRIAKLVTLNARAHHFRFGDLPSQVAFDSFGHGNIVNASVPERSRFASGFEGYTYGGDIGIDLTSSFKYTLGADALVNTKAPNGFGEGLLAFNQVDWKLAYDWILTPRVEYFRNERQTSPAYYNSADYGHNNRHGMGYELRLTRPAQGLAVKVRYTEAYLIETDPLQANSRIFMAYLELFNAP